MLSAISRPTGPVFYTGDFKDTGEPQVSNGARRTPTGVARRYTAEEIETALQMTARVAGNTRHARELLKECDPPLEVPQTTLSTWARKRHLLRYEQIRHELQADTQGRVAIMTEDVVVRKLELEKELLAKIDVDAIPASERTKALRDLSTATGISTSTVMVTRESPLPARQVTRSVTEIWNALEALKVIPGDAEEDGRQLPPADTSGGTQ
jgi:hypothetical protein